MYNDTPLRVRLAEFDFMTAVLDPDQIFSCAARLEGGPLQLMPPELLVAQKFCKKSANPMPQADIYVAMHLG